MNMEKLKLYCTIQRLLGFIDGMMEIMPEPSRSSACDAIISLAEAIDEAFEITKTFEI